MKHVLFFKILMIFFVFGAGINVLSDKYKGQPGMTLANMFVNVAIAILLGVGICWLP